VEEPKTAFGTQLPISLIQELKDYIKRTNLTVEGPRLTLTGAVQEAILDYLNKHHVPTCRPSQSRLAAWKERVGYVEPEEMRAILEKLRQPGKPTDSQVEHVTQRDYEGSEE